MESRTLIIAWRLEPSELRSDNGQREIRDRPELVGEPTPEVMKADSVVWNAIVAKRVDEPNVPMGTEAA